MRQKIVCKVCHKRKWKYGKGYCQQCYQQTDACKQYQKRYRQTDAYKQYQKRYRQTVKQALKEFRAKKEKAKA